MVLDVVEVVTELLHRVLDLVGILQVHGHHPQRVADEVDGEVIKVDTEIVNIPVKISDRQGRFVAGLTKENFKVFEDGVEQEIEYFSNEQQPFTVAPGPLMVPLFSFLVAGRLVALEALGLLLVLPGQEIAQVGDAVASQHAIQRGAAHLGVDELAHEHQQVVDAQEERAAQFDDDLLHLRGEGGLEIVRDVGAVLDRAAPPPLAHRVGVNAVLGRERFRGDRSRSGLNLGTGPRSGGGVLVQSDVHGSSAAAFGASPRRSASCHRSSCS